MLGDGVHGDGVCMVTVCMVFTVAAHLHVQGVLSNIQRVLCGRSHSSSPVTVKKEESTSLI